MEILGEFLCLSWIGTSWFTTPMQWLPCCWGPHVLPCLHPVCFSSWRLGLSRDLVSSASNWVKHCKTQFESRTRLTILLPIRSCESCAGSSPSWSKTALPRRNTHFCWLKAIIQNTLPYSCLPGACPAHVCGLRIFEVLTTALRGTSDWNMVKKSWHVLSVSANLWIRGNDVGSKSVLDLLRRCTLTLRLCKYSVYNPSHFAFFPPPRVMIEWLLVSCGYQTASKIL